MQVDAPLGASGQGLRLGAVGLAWLTHVPRRPRVARKGEARALSLWVKRLRDG